MCCGVRTSSSRLARMGRLAGAGFLAAVGCGGAATPLGPPDSYLLYAPVAPSAHSESGNFPVVDDLDPQNSPEGLLLTRLFADGFTGEMVRSVHLAKQLVRKGTLAG